MKVAAYCRVSTDKEDQINSIVSQQQYFESYINNHEGWELVEIFADEGITGTSTKKRVEFNRMIEMANNKEIDLIITKEVSRFARNTVDTLTHTRQLKSKGVGVLFINDSINTLDNEGEFRLTIMASVAQEESRKTSERVKWGQRRRMEQGVVFCNNAFLGYNVKDGKFLINEDEADIVKDIYNMYVNEGKGSRVIANELNSRGIKPVYAKLWSAETILKILKNEKYVGDILYKKYITVDHLNHTKKLNKNKEDMIFFKDHHEAIIDRETWDKAQFIINSRSKLIKGKSKYSKKYWCSGKLFCGECGARYVSGTTINNGNYTHAWICSTKKNYGSQKLAEHDSIIGCNNHRISDDVILLCLEEALKFYCKNATKLKNDIVLEIKSLNIENNSQKITNLKNKVISLKNKKMSLISSLLDDIITADEFKHAKNGIDLDISKLQSKIDELQLDDSIKRIQVDQFKEIISGIDNIFNLANISERLYDSIIEKIIIFKRSVNVHFFGLSFSFSVSFRISRKNKEYKVIITESKLIEEIG